MHQTKYWYWYTPTGRGWAPSGREEGPYRDRERDQGPTWTDRLGKTQARAVSAWGGQRGGQRETERAMERQGGTQRGPGWEGTRDQEWERWHSHQGSSNRQVTPGSILLVTVPLPVWRVRVPGAQAPVSGCFCLMKVTLKSREEHSYFIHPWRQFKSADGEKSDGFSDSILPWSRPGGGSGVNLTS